MTLILHIATGFTALAAGLIAMSAKKGGWLHRKSGLAFVVSMLAMASLGLILAIAKPSHISVLSASLTLYLVSTAFLTVRGTVERYRRWHVVFAAAGSAIAILGAVYCARSLASPTSSFEGVPSPVWLLFTAVATLCAASDMRLIRRGHTQGTARLIRHLWRMEFAMALACLAFFIGQSKFFPHAIRIPLLLAAPMLLVLLHMGYWVLRTWRQGRRIHRGAATRLPTVRPEHEEMQS